MASARLSRLASWLLLLATAAAILLREPRMLLAPRMWGEDGTNFYRFAFQNGPLAALRYLPVNGPGYYSFLQDAAAALAVLLGPPEWAAQVFLWLSLLAQLSPAIVVLFGRSYVWDTTWKRALVCALLVVSPAAGIELWLNLVIAMNHLGLAALCALLEDLRADVSRARAWGLRLLLVVGGLTGPWVVALTPLFALKARAERSRESRVHLALLLACCLVQGTVVLRTMTQGALDHERATGVPPTMMLNVAAAAHVLRPLVGPLLDRYVDATGIRPALRPDGEPGVYAQGLLVLLPLLLAVGALLAPPPRRWQRWSLLGGLVLSSGVASLGAYGVAVGRYVFIPGLTVALILVDNLGATASAWQRLRRLLSAAVLAVTLGVGIVTWHENRTFPDWEADFAAWSDEVAQWRADPNHSLACMPRIFAVDLQREGIARDFKADVAGLEGVTLGGGGRSELLLPVRGVPTFGRLVLEIDGDAPPEAFTLGLEMLGPDGQPISAGRMATVRRRSTPGHPVLADGLPHGPGLLRVAALRLHLTAASGEGPAPAIKIRRARYGDELLFF